MATIDLSQIDPPDLVEEYDVATLRDEVIADMIAEYPAVVAIVEGDPLYSVAGMIAAREIELRESINAGARVAFLSSAGGADLDQHGALPDIARLVTDPTTTPIEYETDDLFRRAVHSAPHAFGAGSKSRYERAAFNADERIEDVYAGTPTPATLSVEWLPRVGVGAGEHAEIEAKMLAALATTDSEGFQIEMLTDDIVFFVATREGISVVATVYIDAVANQAAIEEQIAADFVEAAVKIAKVRAPVPLSLIYSILDVPGVVNVDLSSPAADEPATIAKSWYWNTPILTHQVASWV